MTTQLECDRCKEPILGQPVVKAGKNYCTEACAFEDLKRPSPFARGV